MKTTRFRLASSLAIFFALVFSAQSSMAAKRKRVQPFISRITIRGANIFDFRTNPALRKFPYTVINWLHIKTREDVIREELLFKVGDRLDPFLIRETERNLRALSFLRAARVTRFPQRDGTVALVVNVQDAWTTEPMINLGGINKVDEIEFGLREKNLLGWGKTVQYLYNKGPNFIERQYQYSDPHLLGSRWQMDGTAKTDLAGTSRILTVMRPFYSATTPWSARVAHSRQFAQVDEFDASNVKISQFHQAIEINEFYMGEKIGGGHSVVSHAGPRYKRESRDYSRTNDTVSDQDIPAPQAFQTIFLDMDTAKTDFIEITHVEKMTRVEDLNLGPQLSLSPGLSPKQLTGAHDVFQLEGSYNQSHLFQETHLFTTSYKYSGRNTFNHPQNQNYVANAKYYYRASPFHTLVSNLSIDAGDNLDKDNLVKLGGDNGLRAFKRGEFVGTKSLLFNLEDRMYLIDDALNLVSIGGAVFYDAGYSWARGRPVAMSDIKSDVGMGLRFGLTRSSNEVIVRLDLSYKLQRESPNDPHFVVTFGSGQAF